MTDHAPGADGVTHAQFAERAARIASVAAAWAADTLILPDYHDKPVSKDALRRFCEAIRFHVDCVERDVTLTTGGTDA